MVCTVNRFRSRSALREVAKAHGLPPETVSLLAESLPHHWYGPPDRQKTNEDPYAELAKTYPDPIHQAVFHDAAALIGLPHHLSVHPGGMVISPGPMHNLVPTIMAAKGVLTTQFDLESVEQMGLVKIDLLGIRGLTVLGDVAESIVAAQSSSPPAPTARLAILEAIPQDDPTVSALLQRGGTIGCFQIETPAMRTLLRNTLADNTDMLIKTLSLVRPGPSGSGMKKRFIARHLGKEPTEYLHPSLARVLGDTYGVMLYQEDILKVANVIAGMDLAEGDMLRRAMTKDRSPREMARSMKTFIEKAVANGVEESVAEEIWGLIANFAAYSYCKAHASTYGEISYQCTYLKAHFPAEFMACVLSNRGGFYHPAVYVEEAKRLGIEVRPPDINKSRFEYAAEGDTIRVGFVEVRQLAHGTVEAILAARTERPFESLGDVWARTGMTRPEAEALIQAGAFDAFGRTRPALFWELHLLAQGKREEAPVNADRLFREHGGEYRTVPRLPDISRKKRTDQEWEALGLVVSTHPLEYYAPLFQERALVSSTDLPRYVDRVVMLVGWLIAERRVGLKGRGCMKFCTFEDPKGVFEAVLFSETYQRYGHLLDSHGP